MNTKCSVCHRVGDHKMGCPARPGRGVTAPVRRLESDPQAVLAFSQPLLDAVNAGKISGDRQKVSASLDNFADAAWRLGLWDRAAELHDAAVRVLVEA